jgi:hypothetical protein
MIETRKSSFEGGCADPTGRGGKSKSHQSRVRHLVDWWDSVFEKLLSR